MRQELSVTPKAVTSLSSADPDAPIQLPAFGARILSARAGDAGADWTYYLQVVLCCAVLCCVVKNVRARCAANVALCVQVSNEDDLTVTYVGAPLTQGSNFPKGTAKCDRRCMKCA